MNSDKRHIEKLLASYYTGKTTLHEERELSEYFCSKNDLTDDRRTDAVLFRGINSLRNENKIKPFIASRRYLWAAVLAAAAISVVAILFAWQKSEIRNEPYCYLNGLAITDYAKAEECTHEIFGRINDNIPDRYVDIFEDLTSEQ